MKVLWAMFNKSDLPITFCNSQGFPLSQVDGLNDRLHLLWRPILSDFNFREWHIVGCLCEAVEKL